MNNLNIPIYRAKKIDSDEYVIGNYIKVHNKFYIYEDGTSDIYLEDEECFDDGSIDGEIRIIDLIFEIDSTTLSIHFPDMLDSQGSKIFASLNEDGKGGDIVKYEQVLGGILKSSGPEECIIKYCNKDHIIAPFFINAKYKNQKTYMTKEHLLRIGIQK